MKDSRSAEIRRNVSDAEGVGRILAARRRRARMRQDEIARIVGKSRKWVSDFERGRVPSASLADVAAFAEALGMGLSLAEIPGRVHDGDTFRNFRDDGSTQDGGGDGTQD